MDEAKDPGYSIFIDHILNNEGMFTDKDIRDHVITVLSAGELSFEIHLMVTVNVNRWSLSVFVFIANFLEI